MAKRRRTTVEWKRPPVLMPTELVEQVDALVGPRERSRFVSDAVAEKLRRERLRGAVAEVAGSLSWGDVPGWETSESAAEWVRARRREWNGANEVGQGREASQS